MYNFEFHMLIFSMMVEKHLGFPPAFNILLTKNCELMEIFILFLLNNSNYLCNS